jgi:glycosyltransferase involved in cell wall biosynthesis
MKIDLFINSLRGGGAERVCVNLANEFVRQGYNVQLNVLNLDSAVYHSDIDEGVIVNNLKQKHARSSIFSILQYLKKDKPSFILVFNHQIAVILVLLRAIFGINTRIISRNINTLSQKKKSEKSIWHKFIVFPVIRLLYKYVDHVIAQSEGMEEDLIDHFGFHPKNITVINNPISTKFINENKKTDTNYNNQILFVGKLYPQKGVHFLLKAFKICLVRNKNLKLLILGDGPLKRELEDLASELNIKNSVTFKPFTKDIITHYKESKMTVLSSLYEGFPNVLVESIAVGTPVVAFDCPSGPREIILEGTNGFLVDYKNINQLAENILKANEKNWDTEKIIESSRRYYPEVVFKKYTELIEKLN